MRNHDREDTLVYADPPYLPETRSGKTRKDGTKKHHVYVHEMSVEEHEELLEVLNDLKGMVILSGYPSEMYDRLLPGWVKVERDAWADGARRRREVLWLNSRAAVAPSLGYPLFHAATATE